MAGDRVPSQSLCSEATVSSQEACRRSVQRGGRQSHLPDSKVSIGVVTIKSLSHWGPYHQMPSFCPATRCPVLHPGDRNSPPKSPRLPSRRKVAVCSEENLLSISGPWCEQMLRPPRWQEAVAGSVAARRSSVFLT